jgi:hypothetical protein
MSKLPKKPLMEALASLSVEAPVRSKVFVEPPVRVSWMVL